MNKLFLKGRISSDIDTRYTQTNNTKIVKFSIAVRRDYKNQNNEYETDFFNCSAFSFTADFIEKYFKKGQEILLIGRIQNRSWETDSGEKRYATDVMVENVEFCGSKNENGNTNNSLPPETKVIENNTMTDELPF